LTFYEIKRQNVFCILRRPPPLLCWI